MTERKNVNSISFFGISLGILIAAVILLSAVTAIPVMPTKVSAENFIVVWAEPGSIPADGSSITTIYANLTYTDGGSHPVGQIVYFELIGDSLGGGLLDTVGLTNEQGIASVPLRAGTTVGEVTVSCSSIDFTNGTTLVQFKSLLDFRVWGSPPSIPAGGDTFTNVIIRLYWGDNPLNKQVTLTTDRGIFNDTGTQTINLNTVDNGHAVTALWSSVIPGDAYITAVWGDQTRNCFISFFIAPDNMTLNPIGPDNKPKDILSLPANPISVVPFEARVFQGLEQLPVVDVFVEFKIVEGLGWLSEINFCSDPNGYARCELHPTYEIGLVRIRAFIPSTPNVPAQTYAIYFHGLARNFVVEYNQTRAPVYPEDGAVNCNQNKGHTAISIFIILYDAFGNRVCQPGQVVKLNTTALVPVFVNPENKTDLNLQIIRKSNEKGIVEVEADFIALDSDTWKRYPFDVYLPINETMMVQHNYTIWYKNSVGLTAGAHILIHFQEPVHILGAQTLIIAQVVDATWVTVLHNASCSVADFIATRFAGPLDILDLAQKPTGDPAIYATYYNAGPGDVIMEGFRDNETIKFVYYDPSKMLAPIEVSRPNFMLINPEVPNPFDGWVDNPNLPGLGGGIDGAQLENVNVTETGDRISAIGDIKSYLPVTPLMNPNPPPMEWHGVIPHDFMVNVSQKLTVHCIEGVMDIVYDVSTFDITGYVCIDFIGQWRLITIDGRFTKAKGHVHIDGIGTISEVNNKLLLLPGFIEVTNFGLVNVNEDGFMRNNTGMIAGEGDFAVLENGTYRMFKWSNFGGDIVSYNIFSFDNASNVDWTDPDYTVSDAAEYYVQEIPEIETPTTGLDDKFTEEFFVVEAIDSSGDTYMTVESSLGGDTSAATREIKSSRGISAVSKIAAGGAIPLTITGSISRTLNAGEWNIISVPFATTLNASGLADQIGPNCNAIYQRDPETGEFNGYLVEYDDPSDAFPINQTAAYYVWVTADTNITFAGSINYDYYSSSESYQIQDDLTVDLKGQMWTLVSYPSFIHASMNVVFNTSYLAAGSIVQVALIDTDSVFAYYIKDTHFPMNEIFQVVPGEGYYVWTSSSTTITWTPK